MAIKYLFHRSVFFMTRGASGHIAVVFHIYFLKTGGACGHEIFISQICFFDDKRGIWSYSRCFSYLFF